MVSKFFSAILFAFNFPVASAVMWTTFLKALFASSSLALVAMSYNFFPYVLDGFLTNVKNPYPSTYFLVLGSMK